MADEIFDQIYKESLWRWNESFSGPGSELAPTKNLVKHLPYIVMELGARSIADLGCGDFFWMQHVAFSGISYFGGDSVEGLIEENKKKYESDNYKFAVHDLVNDPTPDADIIFIRDVFIHLNLDSILKSLDNIKKSKAKWLLATTHNSSEDLDKYYKLEVNSEITPGDFRPVDLQASPFNLPRPEKMFEEAEVGKYLGIWNLDKIRDIG